ncbi:MAG: hypothetical protein ACTSRZ_16660 [Promethearchaeota archaeon]
MITKNYYNKKLFPIFGVISIILIALARLMWGWGNPSAEEYSDIWETISGLGNWKQSPVGFLYFQLWGLNIGIFIMHIIGYVHNNMMQFKEYPIKFLGLREMFPNKKPIKIGDHNLIAFNSEDSIKFGTFFLILGGIGFILMGLIPDDVISSIKKFHEICAGIGFAGILFADLCYTNVLDQAMKDGKINKKMHIFSQILWWFLIIGTIVTYGIAELYYKPLHNLGWYGPEWGEAGVPWIFSFSVWERFGVIVGYAYLGLLGWILPEKTERL